MSIARDRGFPELYQYIKEYWIIVLLLLFFLKKKQFGYLAWTLLFCYLLIDDAMSIHEKIGFQIANHFGFGNMWGLRARDFGELIVTTIAAMVLLPLICSFYAKGTKGFKTVFIDLMFLLLIVVFFGIFMDILHVPFKAYGWQTNFIFGFVEDGGEMIAMSVLVWYGFYLNTHSEPARIPLFASMRDILISRIGYGSNKTEL